MAVKDLVTSIGPKVKVSPGTLGRSQQQTSNMADGGGAKKKLRGRYRENICFIIMLTILKQLEEQTAGIFAAKKIILIQLLVVRFKQT